MTKTATTAAPITVTKTQHRVLACLAAAGGPMRRAAIISDAFGGTSKNLRVVIDPLKDAKLVRTKTLDVDGKKEETIEITPAGKKVAAKPLPPKVTANGDSLKHTALPKVGGTFTKVYKGETVTVKVVEGGFQVGEGKKAVTYTSLTAAAKGIRGTDMEVNGWAFFGMVKKVEA